MDFKTANKVIHKVEDQWHYPIMIKHGYIPQNKKGTGFVRSYRYLHPETKEEITCATGANADYWTIKDGNGGYWNELENYMKSRR